MDLDGDNGADVQPLPLFSLRNSYEPPALVPSVVMAQVLEFLIGAATLDLDLLGRSRPRTSVSGRQARRTRADAASSAYLTSDDVEVSQLLNRGTRFARTRSIQRGLAPQSNSVALGSSPCARRALVGCGLWAGTECRASSGILRRLGRQDGYVFFPIPNHLRSFAMRLAIGRVYAVTPIEMQNPPRRT